MIVYFDASALVKRYIEEKGSKQVKKLFETANIEVVTSSITRAEVVAALAKARRMKILAENDALKARFLFEKEWGDIATIDADSAIAEHAAELAWKHDLRGFDSVHLASALFLYEQLPQKFIFATFDKGLWKAAEEYLTPWPNPLP